MSIRKYFVHDDDWDKPIGIRFDTGSYGGDKGFLTEVGGYIPYHDKILVVLRHFGIEKKDVADKTRRREIQNRERYTFRLTEKRFDEGIKKLEKSVSTKQVQRYGIIW